jgi:formylglycine-generating enzyme
VTATSSVARASIWSRSGLSVGAFFFVSSAFASGERMRTAREATPPVSDIAIAGAGVRVALRAPPMDRVRIPAGSFVMGSSSIDVVRATAMCRKELAHSICDRVASQFRAQMLAHEVTLDGFLIDRTEVTVRDYERCVAAGACTSAAYPRGDGRFGRPELPVTHVRWEDAERFCTWSGGRLPTEAEWEYTARGPTSREFPWGSFYNPHLCNHGALAADDTDASDGFTLLAPVGSFPDGGTPLGVLDLAGNVSEWVSDVFSVADETGFGYSAKAVRSPKGPQVGGFHVIRGGSFQRGAAWMRAAWRDEISAQMSPDVGFRCAANVD